MAVIPSPSADQIGTGTPRISPLWATIALSHVLSPEVLESLGMRLYSKMEELDPNEESEWGKLTDHQREFYRCCAVAISEECRWGKCQLQLPSGQEHCRTIP
jgi:hypothetical protein